MTEKKDITKKIKLRKIKKEDYLQITAVQQKCFPGMKPWSERQFDNLLRIFPDGQSCIQYGKKIIASSCSLIINFDEYKEDASWKELTDSGNITNHKPIRRYALRNGNDG